jgi:hypothetical protein
LLKDAEQVKAGGDSTIAIRRKAKIAAEAAVEVQEEE